MDLDLAIHDACTGCGACAKACPKQAISFEADFEGFPSPHVDSANCIECGLCTATCPILNMPITYDVQCAYAAQIRDQKALQESTSGGAFTVFSREVFRNGGVVFGCVWDRACNAVICEAENEEEIKPMRGSKYVWSWAGDSFPEAKAALDKGREVLFSGLPCQIAGLKGYLGKDYDKLYTLDFLCSGAPSPLALQKYIETICIPPIDRGSLNLKFRDKKPHGVGVHITYNGQKKRPERHSEHISNPYYYSFYSHLIDRRCCYKCPHGTAKRVSDLTICDYWGVANYHKQMNVRAGISALLVNTEKGRGLLHATADSFVLELTDIRDVSKENNLIIEGSRNRKVPEMRNKFFAELKSDGWHSAEKKCLRNPLRLKQWLRAKVPGPFVAVAKRFLGK